MAVFTGNGYLVADITALLAIPLADRPAFKVAILVAGLGWHEYDPSATTGGLTPADNPASGRWFQLDNKNIPWQIASVADITALLAISLADRPAFKVAVLVAGLGWYEYDPSATTGGLTPADNPASGRWFQLNTSTPWIIVSNDFNAQTGKSYLNPSSFLPTITLPLLSSLTAGQSIRYLSLGNDTLINTQDVPYKENIFATGRISPGTDNYGNVIHLQIASVIINEFVFDGSSWLLITGTGNFR